MASQCVGSLLENNYPNLQVYLVDNGSVEPCGERLKEQFPEIEIVVLPKNQGFAGGMNRGLERALEDDPDYIFLLNNDTLIHSNALPQLSDYLDGHDDVGAVSAFLITTDTPPKLNFHSGKVYRGCAFLRHPGKGIPVDEEEWETVGSDFVPACAVLYRADALRSTGLFDERLFVCWEDYDLCLRLTDSGWKLVTLAEAVVEHHHGATTGRTSPYITYYYMRNWLICLFRHGRPFSILVSLPRSVLVLLLQMQRYGLTNWPAHRALLRGFRHALFGVRGEGSPPRKRRD
jgi:GT2 family glycosyltransferase